MTSPPKVRELAIANLRPHPENPRTITAAEFEQLKARLTKSPHMLHARPLIALPDGTVIAGNQRLAAARALGWSKIRVCTVDLPDAEAREWALIDNNGFGDWQHEQLVQYLNDAHELGADLTTVGFTERELEELLDGTNADEILEPPAGGDTSAGERPEDPITQPGDVIELGDHLLLCGNSDHVDQLDRLYPGIGVAFVLGDPPYGIDLDTDGAHRSGLAKSKSFPKVLGDDRAFDVGFFVEYFAGIGAGEQVWFGAEHYRPVPVDGSWLVWDKRTDPVTGEVMGGDWSNGQFELAWSRASHARLILRHLHHGFMGEDARGRVHPTQKPIPLIEDILTRWAPAACVVADPFAGSGSTLIACENTGRTCLAVELDPGYCDVIVDRWERHTGRTAIRPTGGTT